MSGIKTVAHVLVLIQTALLMACTTVQETETSEETAATASNSAASKPEEPSYLSSARQIGRFYLSAQPDAMAIDTLADGGVDAVISFRTQEEMQSLEFDQSQLLGQRGIAYHLIQTGGENHPYSHQQLDTLSDILNQNPSATILMHCRSGYRAGVVLAAWYVQHKGLDIGKALERVGDERISADDVKRVLGIAITQQ